MWNRDNFKGLQIFTLLALWDMEDKTSKWLQICMEYPNLWFVEGCHTNLRHIRESVLGVRTFIVILRWKSDKPWIVGIQKTYEKYLHQLQYGELQFNYKWIIPLVYQRFMKLSFINSLSTCIHVHTCTCIHLYLWTYIHVYI